MRKLLLFTCLVLSGCQTMETKSTAQITESPQPTPAPTPFVNNFAEGKVSKEWFEKRDKAVIALNDKTIAIGANRRMVHEIWGQPDQSASDSNEIVDWYDSPNEPIFFIYSKKTASLLEIKIDRDKIAKYEQHRRFRRLETKIDLLEYQINRLIANQPAPSSGGQDWQALSNSLQNYSQQIQLDNLQRQQFMQQQQMNQIHQPAPNYLIPQRK